jgi:exonuclease SbcD
MDELRALAAEAGPDDAIRIRWEIDEEHAGSVDKALIRDLFAGAESCKLEARVLPVQRVRAAGIGKAMSLADKLAYWAGTTGSTGALERLQDRLALVQSMDTEAIVGCVVEADQAEAERQAAYADLRSRLPMSFGELKKLDHPYFNGEAA